MFAQQQKQGIQVMFKTDKYKLIKKSSEKSMEKTPGKYSIPIVVAID